MAAIEVRRLVKDDAGAYRALMLEAYALEPDAFTSTANERQHLSLDWWAARIGINAKANEFVFGAFEGEKLIGIAGLARETRERTRHKASLFGMFVASEARGNGIARRLVKAVLEQAKSVPELTVVQLTVTESNRPAVALYESCGFTAFGVEPCAVRVDARFVSKVHMYFRLVS